MTHLWWMRALWCVALPIVALRLAWRALKDRSYRAHWRERFGWGVPRGPFDVWIHAVSVGETRAAEPLIKALLARDATVKILLTHMTPTGRAAGEALFGARLTQCFVPYDFAPSVSRFLRQARPLRGVIMETELWPELIAQCHARGVEIWLANARLSEKSARGYARFALLTRATLTRMRGVLAQDEATAARFKALGADHVEVLGNMKFEVTPPADVASRATALQALVGDGPMWIAASTREGDEMKLLEALRTHPLRNSARAWFVPRHPQRFDEVFLMAQKLGFSVARRSRNQPVPVGTEIVLGDSMGEMFAYYACAKVAFMGGSFATGSQNLIEPCAMGVPVVLGPSVFNFEAAAAAALACGAARQVESAAQVLDEIEGLLNDAQQLHDASAAAHHFSKSLDGVCGTTVKYLFDEK